MFDDIIIAGDKFFANKTLEWVGEDNLENFEKHAANPVTRKRLESAGWFDKKILYQFNSLGFRSEEFVPAGDYFCLFGCSFTLGSAIQQEQRYGDIVAQRLGLKSYNFGLPGGSDSASFRLALTWLNKLNPKFIVYQTTFPQRFEIINNKISIPYGVSAMLGGSLTMGSSEIYKQIISNEENSELLAIKNQLAMRELCRSKSIKLIEISYVDFLKTHDISARDLHHPGEKANQSVAENILNTL